MGENVEEGERMKAWGPRRNCVRVWNLRGSCHMQRIAQKATNCWRLPTTRKLSLCISPHEPWILPKPTRTEGHDRFSRFEGNRQLGDLCGTASMESCRAVGTIGCGTASRCNLGSLCHAMRAVLGIAICDYVLTSIQLAVKFSERAAGKPSKETRPTRNDSLDPRARSGQRLDGTVFFLLFQPSVLSR